MNVEGTSALIWTEHFEGILRVAIRRPDKKNALTTGMYSSLAEALRRSDEDPSVRVILLHGTEDCFTSGNDLQDFMHSPPTGESSPAHQFLMAVSRAAKPIVAAVAGPAVGVGTTLLLHCDLVYAGESSRFQLPFVNLGLCPEAASSFLLPRLAGHQRACELLLLGEPFSASTAREIGLVNAVLPDSEVLAHALEQARKLAAKPMASLLITKRLIKASSAERVSETLAAESRIFFERLASPEAAEAFAAFFERRKPDFSRFQAG